MKNVVKYSVCVLITFVVGIQSAWAATLGDAKAKGLIGEATNGYIGFVVASSPADVKALVGDVNKKRKAKYTEVAKKQSIPVAEVEKIAGKKAIQKTKSGHYIQVQGAWVKKP